MSFDNIFDLTAGVYFYFYFMLRVACRTALGFVCGFSLGYYSASRVTGACPGTTDGLDFAS